MMPCPLSLGLGQISRVIYKYPGKQKSLFPWDLPRLGIREDSRRINSGKFTLHITYYIETDPAPWEQRGN